MVAPWSQRLERPVEHHRQWPHTGRNEQMTWSPGCSRVTPGPTASMTPAPSWPPTMGNRGTMSPCHRCSSEWHRPAATNRISTPPAFGSSSSHSPISKGWWTSRRTAALVFIDPPGLGNAGRVSRGPRCGRRSCSPRPSCGASVSWITRDRRSPRPRSVRGTSSQRTARGVLDRPGVGPSGLPDGPTPASAAEPAQLGEVQRVLGRGDLLLLAELAEGQGALVLGADDLERVGLALAGDDQGAATAVGHHDDRLAVALVGGDLLLDLALARPA